MYLFIYMLIHSFAHLFVITFFSSVASSSLRHHGMPGFPVNHQLPELAQTHFHQVSDAVQPCHPLLSPSPPPSVFSSIRVFSNESVLDISCPKYWSFSFSISLSNEYSALTPFRIDWFDPCCPRNS